MERSKSIVKVSLVGIAANLVLVAFKAAVGLLTGSIAVILDAVNNLSDALSSVITIVGTRLAQRPPDKKHPYGYGRIENITSLTIAVIVLLAGFTSFRESLEKAIHPEEASYTAASLFIIAAAVVVKFFLGRYVKAQGEKLNSDSLVASGSDAAFDSVISLATLAAAAVSLLWGLSIEGYLGVIIAVIIIKAGVEILIENLSGIIGQRVSSSITTALREKVLAVEGVRGVYDIVLHRYGPEKLIGSLHIEVDDSLTARDIHLLTRRITEEVYADFGIVLTVGIYAANEDDELAAGIKRDVIEIVGSYPEFRQLHGFYLDERRGYVSFDIILEFGSDTQKIYTEILDRISRRYPQYAFNVVIDSDFSD